MFLYCALYPFFVRVFLRTVQKIVFCTFCTDFFTKTVHKTLQKISNKIKVLYNNIYIIICIVRMYTYIFLTLISRVCVCVYRSYCTFVQKNSFSHPGRQGPREPS